MDATDFAIGIALVGIIVWVSIIALNLNVASAEIADLYVLTALNKPLISVEEACPIQGGFELVEPKGFDAAPYYILSGRNDFNQTYFCFYRKT